MIIYDISLVYKRDLAQTSIIFFTAYLGFSCHHVQWRGWLGRKVRLQGLWLEKGVTKSPLQPFAILPNQFFGRHARKKPFLSLELRMLVR